MNFLRLFLFVLLTIQTSLFGESKVVLLNDTSAWYHWGCTGTSTALKEKITALGFEVTTIPIQVSKEFKDVPDFDEFDDKDKFNLFFKSNPSLIETLQQADAVVITGEGTLHDLRLTPKALLYLAYIAKVHFLKHVEIINHSAYPKDLSLDQYNSLLDGLSNSKEEFREWLKAETYYKKVYEKLDFIAIREPISLQVMQEIGINAIESFDCLPLYIRDHYAKPKKIKEKTLVISGSVAHTQEGIKNFCQYLEFMSKEGYHIELLTGAAAYPAYDDKVLVKSLTTYCKVPFRLVDAQSMDEWLETIQSATLFISGRFHHSIAAFCLNTPFITLNSNTPKVQAIDLVLGQPEPLEYSAPDLKEKLVQRTQQILRAPNVDNSFQMTKLCESAEKNFEGLSSFLISKETTHALAK